MTTRLGFLIMAHSEPDHVARLVRRLAPIAAGIWVHVNQKSEIAPFQSVALPSCAFVRERVAVTWGTASFWEAVLSAMKEALASGRCDRLVLLSQSCYPLVSPERVRDFFAANPEGEFIGAKPIWLQQIGLWRLKFDMRRNDLPSWMIRRPISGLVRRLAITRPTLDWRTPLRGMVPYSGCLWWSLTVAACAHVVEAYESRPGLRDYAQGLFGPEEIIPHTLLKNSPFASAIRHHLTYEDWSRGGASPKWLGMEDVKRVVQPGFKWRDRYGKGPALFARKFGGAEGSLACDWLDERLET